MKGVFMTVFLGRSKSVGDSSECYLPHPATVAIAFGVIGDSGSCRDSAAWGV